MPPVSTSVKALSAPFGLGGDAVAGDAGLVVDDGDAPAGDAIEQGGLADIGSADDGNKAWHDDKMPHRAVRRKEKMQGQGCSKISVPEGDKPAALDPEIRNPKSEGNPKS